MNICTGISYSAFNGEEHLLSSLKTMRHSVDYINIVVQYVSNQGFRAKESLELVLEKANDAGYVDRMIEYVPDFAQSPSWNEHQKRNMGLEFAKQDGVTHFMTMDCDEYYPANEFAAPKAYLLAEGIDTTAVHSYLHIKRPIYRSAIPDTTYCQFLTRIQKDSEIVMNDFYPVLVDPTRRLHGDRASFFTFPVEIISMRHMNLVRYDLEWKLNNSTNATATEFMNKVRAAYNGWSFGKVLNFPNKPPMDIILVEDIFGIDKDFSNQINFPVSAV